MSDRKEPIDGGDLDDKVLIELATPLKDDIAPWLSRAPMMYPLAICLGFLPPLLLLPYVDLDDASARFGLICLNQAYAGELDNAPSATQAVDYGYLIPVRLTSWLISVTNGGGFDILLVVPICSLVLTTYLLWNFVSRVFNARRALLVCLLFVSTPFFLGQTMIPQSHCLGLACLIGALWGWIVHLETKTEYFSKSLFAGGLAWGLSFLTGGASAWLALALAVLLTDHRFHSWISRSSAVGALRETGSWKRDWFSLGIWTATGLTCSLLISLGLRGMVPDDGETRWRLFPPHALGELELENGVPIRANVGESQPLDAERDAQHTTVSEMSRADSSKRAWTAAFARVWNDLGWLTGFAFCGLIGVCFRRNPQEAESVRHRAILPLWIGLGLLAYSLAATMFISEHARTVLQCWLNVGWIFLAAEELDQLLKRRHGWWSIACVWLVSLSLLSLSFTKYAAISPIDRYHAEIAWWGSMAIVLLAVVILLSVNQRQLIRERWLTGLMIVWPLLAQYVQIVPFEDDRGTEIHQLETFCREVRGVSDGTGTVFISQYQPSPRMRYMISSYDPGVIWEILPETETLSNHMARRFPSLGTSLVIHWGESENLLRLLRSEGLDFQSVTSPRFFEHEELHALSVIASSREHAGIDAVEEYWNSRSADNH